nr:unnamed protein product [Digitaria exilis]
MAASPSLPMAVLCCADYFELNGRDVTPHGRPCARAKCAIYGIFGTHG